MWDEGDAMLPSSREVPKRMAVMGRTRQDTGCFGLYTFTMVLFMVQSLSALIGANYQLPHEFELCERRLAQESVPVANMIPESEIHSAEQAEKRKPFLVGVDGSHVALPPAGGSPLLPSVPAGSAAAAVVHQQVGGKQGRHLLAVRASELTGKLSSLAKATAVAAHAARGPAPEPAGAGSAALQSPGQPGATQALSGAPAEGSRKVAGGGEVAAAGALLDGSVGALDIAGKVVTAEAEHAGAAVEAEAAQEMRTLANGTAAGAALGRIANSSRLSDDMGALAIVNGSEPESARAVRVGGGDDDKDKYDPDEAEDSLEAAVRRVRRASLMVVLLACASVAAGALWVTLLSWFPEAFILLTVSSVPFALALLAAYALILRQPLAAAAAVACLGLAFALIFKLQARLSFTAKLLACAGRALSKNWSVIAISIALSCIQVLWLGFALFAVGLSFMSGEAVRVHDVRHRALPGGDGQAVPNEHCEWRTDEVAYVGMAFISVVMLWSNAILNEMKRYVITGTIALWYMHKVGDYETPRIPALGSMLPPEGLSPHAQEAYAQEQEAEEAEKVVVEGVPALTVLGWALRYSFGSLCFSALVSGPCEAIKAVLRPPDWEDVLPGPNGKRRPPPPDAGARTHIWHVLQDAIGFVNPLAVPMAAVSGHPFCHCAKVTNLLQMRSRITSLILDPSPALILRTGAVLAAAGSAIAWLALASAFVSIEGPASGRDTQSAIAAGLGAGGGGAAAAAAEAAHWTVVERFFLLASLCVSTLVLNFFASVLLDASDAMLLLLAIDRDNDTVSPNGQALHVLLESEHEGKPLPSARSERRFSRRSARSADDAGYRSPA